MQGTPIHQCECEICQGQKSPGIMNTHYQMNLFMSRLDEQEQRWYAALEATKLGHGGQETMAKITGLHVNTIRRGQAEMANGLSERPHDRVRIAGGGRPSVEKKSPKSRQR